MKSSLAVGSIALVCWFAPAASLAEGSRDSVALPSKDEEAHDFHVRAQAAFESSDFEQARGLFLQAWAIKKSPAIALGLGQTECELKRYRDCAEHLDAALRDLPKAVSQDVKDHASKAFAEAKAQVAVLNATCNRPGADIIVDGKLAGKSPLVAPLYLEPGTHDIAAQLDNNSITRPIAVMAGQEYDLNLPLISQNRQLAKRPAEAPPAGTVRPNQAGTPDLADAEEHRRSPFPLLVGGALFVTGLATGIVFTFDANSKFRNADSMRSKLSGPGCNPPSISAQFDCAALGEAAESGDRSRNMATAGFILAGATLAGTVAYWLWPANGEKATSGIASRIHIGLGLTDHVTGLVMSGDY